MRKPIILIAVLLVPIGVFLFLRYFGKNEFDIPVFYTDKMEKKADCNFEYLLPYLVPDSLTTTLHLNTSKSVLIVDSSGMKKDFANLSEEFSKEEFSVVFLSELPKEKSRQLTDCILFLSPEFSAVLVDDKRQIRGYYKLQNREEMDKLDVELKVLLKKY